MIKGLVSVSGNQALDLRLLGSRGQDLNLRTLGYEPGDMLNGLPCARTAGEAGTAGRVPRSRQGTGDRKWTERSSKPAEAKV
ncbi:hypothetical protein Ssi02_66100 [Sinosporangium siamense]|uniref:Uncharacterized protein n=1 Tax=Sinosporangium siamense TaxID=1367973 RepID=A0A919VFR4_9ACTN|nr:hypothetical protein Ssi02_66100 [Sinosporangium siamense]